MRTLEQNGIGSTVHPMLLSYDGIYAPKLAARVRICRCPMMLLQSAASGKNYLFGGMNTDLSYAQHMCFLVFMLFQEICPVVLQTK